jgi:hypothetical protein
MSLALFTPSPPLYSCQMEVENTIPLGQRVYCPRASCSTLFMVPDDEEGKQTVLLYVQAASMFSVSGMATPHAPRSLVICKALRIICSVQEQVVVAATLPDGPAGVRLLGMGA